MGDGSRSTLVKSLKDEWNLLWESIAGEKEDEKNSEPDAFVTGKLEALTLDQVKEITKSLSDDRKKLNQKLEKLNKEIDLNSAKLESLRLVGSQDETTLKRIVELNDLGQSMAESLHRLDLKLRRAHQREEEIRQELASS
jgi:hypothetical protein